MSKFTKYLPLLITLVGASSTFLSPAVAAFWSAHPQLVSTIAGIYATVKWLLPSPVQK